MAIVTGESTRADPSSSANRKLPAGVRHVAELMPLVLARYGVALEGDGNDGVISLAPWLTTRPAATQAFACSAAVTCY